MPQEPRRVLRLREILVNTVRVVAEVKYRPVYVCDGCGREVPGDTHSKSVDCATFEELMEILSKAGKSANGMPVGWASVYSPKKTLYKCDHCLANQ